MFQSVISYSKTRFGLGQVCIHKPSLLYTASFWIHSATQKIRNIILKTSKSEYHASNSNWWVKLVITPIKARQSIVCIGRGLLWAKLVWADFFVMGQVGKRPRLLWAEKFSCLLNDCYYMSDSPMHRLVIVFVQISCSACFNLRTDHRLRKFHFHFDEN